MYDSASNTTPFTLEDARTEIQSIREAKPVPSVNKTEVLFDRVKDYLLQNGSELFPLDGEPHYFDRTGGKLYKINKDSHEWALLMQRLGFISQNKDGGEITFALAAQAMNSPERAVGRFSLTQDDTCYVYASRTQMFKVTPDNIYVVPLGTDNVILRAADLSDLPVNAIMDKLAAAFDRIGGHTTKFLPGTALAKLTTRYDDSDTMTFEQQQQMVFTRLMFTLAADRYLLYPPLLGTGPTRSGKSTPSELWLAMLTGKMPYLGQMPGKEDDFDATAVNSTFFIADNIDGVAFKKTTGLEDRICGLATGYTASKRRMYTNSEVVSSFVRGHLITTCCTMPNWREDTTARTLIFTTKSPQGGTRKNKAALLNAVIEDQPAMIAELLVRAQNILIAHQEHAYKDYSNLTVSGMDGYEEFTYICSEHEGTFAETRELWTALTQRQNQAQRENNAMLYAIRLFLGKGASAAKQAMTTGILPTQLFQAIQEIYKQFHLPMTYSNLNNFGRNLSKNLVALSAVGVIRKRTKNGDPYLFNPSTDELQYCKLLYDGHYNERLAAAKPGDPTPYRRSDEGYNDLADAKNSPLNYDFDDLDVEGPVN